MRLKMEFECPPLVQVKAIDSWLDNAFQLKVQPMPQIGAAGIHQSAAMAYAWRMMHLAASLLRAARVPAFEPGAIVEFGRSGRKSGAWQMELLVPGIEHIGAAFQQQAFNAAGQALQWMRANPFQPESAPSVYRMLDDSFVKPFGLRRLGAESTIPVLESAFRQGIPFRHLGRGIYLLGTGAGQLLVDRGSVQMDSAIGARLSNHKWLAANLLRAAGLPAPVHAFAASEEEAVRVASGFGWPVVVKPADRERGEGITVGIRSEEALREAYRLAASLSKEILVERHAAGVCHRLFVANGTLRVAGKRLPKAVQGDGQRTVRELVENANAQEARKPPWLRLKPFVLDDLALQCLADDGLAPESVPAESRYAFLRPMQRSEWGGVVETVTGHVHPDNVEAALAAARLFRLDFIGVDMISTDISRPWHENGAIINEVNYSPQIGARTGSERLEAILGELLPGGGHIPVEVVLGPEGKALEHAMKLQESYAAGGAMWWVASRDASIAPSGETLPRAAPNLFRRALTLLTDRRVEALLLAAEPRELLEHGLPMSRVARVHVLDAAAMPQLEEARRLIAAYSDAEFAGAAAAM